MSQVEEKHAMGYYVIEDEVQKIRNIHNWNSTLIEGIFYYILLVLHIRELYLEIQQSEFTPYFIYSHAEKGNHWNVFVTANPFRFFVNILVI